MLAAIQKRVEDVLLRFFNFIGRMVKEIDNLDKTDNLHACSFEEALAATEWRMYRPYPPVNITVVDNDSEDLDAMMKVLEIWPNIEAEGILVVKPEDVYPLVYKDGIILLNGEMEGVDGKGVKEQIYEKGFSGIIIYMMNHNIPKDGYIFRYDYKSRIRKDQFGLTSFIILIDEILTNFDLKKKGATNL